MAVQIIDKEKINTLKKAIYDNNKKIVLLTHKNPDGDALGSILAMYHFLKKSGQQVSMVVPNKYPDFLSWMPEISNLIVFTEKDKAALQRLKEAELMICLDFNSLTRVDHLRDHWGKFNAQKVLIDHHPDPEEFANIVFSDTSMSSTAELVYYIIQELDSREIPDKKIAECLYVGIMTDTGNFSYNSSNPNTFHVVASLLKAGIRKDHIYSSVYDNFSFQRMQLLGLCLNSNMQYFPEYRTAIISITAEELNKYDFKIGDTEGFVNYPLSIKDVIFSALFIEKKDHIKISFRSKGSFPANEFSKNHFSGGGHLNAAGGESDLSLLNALKKFRQLLPEYKAQLLKDEG